ncbi:MAG: phospholipase D-like domain-containing protein [Acidobacteriota bacterium]|nr:phospholipase D-like domain-containing protein [Acidobacteriota bacterium]
MTVAVPVWVLIVAGLILVGLVIALWSVKRRRRPLLDVESDSTIEDLLPSIAGLTQGTIVEGNRIELLQNGALWDRLFADFDAARETIHFETFLAKDGELVRRFTNVLAKKAREGVEVRIMLDGSGGRHIGKENLRKLRDAGATVNRYHVLGLGNLGLINNRDHRKLSIIDGRVAYVGGHCLVDTWLGNAEDKQHFRDITARVEGPVVAQVQSTFAENWIQETGEVPAGEEFFPKLEPKGETRAHVVWTSPEGSPSTLKVLHYLAIHMAKKSLTIQNPYFLPDPDARDALVNAVERGVNVRIMIPSTNASDAKIVQHASHHHYGTLLKGGVKLYDYETTLLHQKVITVDGCWSAIGSTNFDDRSFELNDEVALVTYDERIARELEETFERDLRQATEAKLEPWKKRGVVHKLIDFCAFLFNEQM